MAAVSRQCGMTRVRSQGAADPAMLLSGGPAAVGAHGGHSPYRGRGGASNGGFGASVDFGAGGRASRLAVAAANQWAWAADSPRRGGGGGGAAPRCLLMVREAVLLNSLKRLMVAVPSYEASINRWGGGASVPPPGPPQSPTRQQQPQTPQSKGSFDPYSYSDDVAPHVGAQFAQVSVSFPLLSIFLFPFLRWLCCCHLEKPYSMLLYTTLPFATLPYSTLVHSAPLHSHHPASFRFTLPTGGRGAAYEIRCCSQRLC